MYTKYIFTSQIHIYTHIHIWYRLTSQMLTGAPCPVTATCFDSHSYSPAMAALHLAVAISMAPCHKLHMYTFMSIRAPRCHAP